MEPRPGDPSAAGRVLRRAGRMFGGANLVGALTVFGYFFLVPAGEGIDGWTVVTFAVFMGLSMAAGTVGAWRHMTSAAAWLIEGRSATPEERSATVALPWTFAIAGFRFWVLASILFGTTSGVQGTPARDVARVVTGILLGGLAAGTMSYLLLDRVLRPVVALALAGEAPPSGPFVGVRQRLVLSWALGSGVPLLAIAASPFGDEAERVDAVDLAVLAVIGVLAGGAMVGVAARSVSDRITAVRTGLRRVEQGDTGVELAVDEGGEVGQLQAGFNEMVLGLRERQRLHDLFGRHVGEEVARQALESVAHLGGERRDVSVLFVDVIRSTALAAALAPEQVVAMLNDLFGAVVRAISAERGWVNKFEGDGALCVFGAPADQPDHAASALRAALRLRDEIAALADRHPQLDYGIGISSGTAVAGNVGAEERYEYTVIGDPVNEAARLTEAAKERPARILASQATVTAAGGEAEHWAAGPVIQLRGRPGVTHAYEPNGAAHAVG